MQRQAEPEEEEEEEAVQTKGDGGPAPASFSIASGINSLRGGGRPLSESSRAFFEPRFGVDFSAVRVHTDSHANHLARGISAKAFTAGKDVVFGPGQFASNTSGGKQLLAHELAHVVQQNGGSTPLSSVKNFTNRIADSHIQRFPYETRGIPLSRTQITTLAGQSYWEQRTFRAFVTTLDPRLTSNAEERDAVLSALWATNPARRVRRRQVQFLPVASRTLPAPAGRQPQTAPQLLYKLTFQPPASRGARPRLEIAFVVSGTAAVAPTAVPAAPAGFQPATPNSTSFSGFPGTAANQLAAYWTAHPQEHQAVFNFIENTAPASFDQVIEARTLNNRGRIRHRSVFRVEGQHAGSTINRLNITLVNQGTFTVSAQQSVPANYRDRDMGDLEIETLQAQTPAANRLGTVTLPANLPADERLPVKYTIWQYFSAGNARNTEVDAIVPVGTGARTVLYTFIFGARNNVTVTRVGATGTAAGQIDLKRISVTRARGFPGATATPAALRTWWSTRYPRGGALTPVPTPAAQPRGGPTPAAPTAAVLIADMNRLIVAGIANRTWFSQNYGIDVLDSAATATRLQNVHSVPRAMTGDTVNFSVLDLRMLEIALQTLSGNDLGHLRGIKLGRKTASIQRTRSGFRAAPTSQYGVTLMDRVGTTRNITVLYFQSLYTNNANLFRGSTAANVLPEVTMGMLHELGHATEYSIPAIRAAFRAWIHRHPQTAPTWYAASSPAHELFPEAFALYHTDPRFLCNRSPLLYAWFDQLARTGTPPAANATLTAPATCP